MGKKKVYKDTPIDKSPKEPIPDNLEKEIEKTTKELLADKVEEKDAIVDGVDMALNIRKEPEVKKDNQVAVLKKGTKLVVIDPKRPIKNKDGEWYRIKVVDKDKDVKGYAMKKYIRII